MWRALIRAFLRERTGARIAETIPREPHCIHRMLLHLRQRMARDVPARFAGTVEIDDTFVGGQWRNQPWHIRRHGTKRGRGTAKQPILGFLHRRSGRAVVAVVPNLQERVLAPIIMTRIRKGSRVYTDGAYAEWRSLGGYHHASVNHVQGEYVRGDVHTNGIEGFWGYLKRRLKTTGGIRRSRLPLYVAEEVWRYNHRTLTLDEQTDLLYEKLVEG